MAETLYVIALGSNRRHGRHGAPAATLSAAIEALGQLGLIIEAVSTIHNSGAVGPAGRSFANAALILSSALDPPGLLAELKRLEKSFGRRAGRRWGPRVLDLDILLWSGGAWEGGGLVIPHPSFRDRLFVLDPLVQIAPGWIDPLTGATVRQLRARLTKPRPIAAKPG